jgi:CBS domain-containing protein
MNGVEGAMRQESVETVIRDRGSDELVSVPAAATVAEAVAVMAEREIGAVIVLSEDKLVSGIFSERDLLTRVVQTGRDAKTTPISLVMTRDVRFVSPGTSIEAALALMHILRFRHLLVIDGPHVHGLISMRDLVAQLIRHGEGRFEATVRAVEAATPTG